MSCSPSVGCSHCWPGLSPSTYVVVQALEPGGFIAALEQQGSPSWTELLYPSLNVLSSTGLSDVVPMNGHAGSVAMIERLCGLFNVAMVLTRLVGLKTLRVKSRL